MSEWKVHRLGDVCEIARGGSPRPIKEYITDDPEGINWVKISDATASDKYIFKTAQRITKEGIKRSREVKDGDFILSNSMSFGRPYIMRTSGCIHDGWLLLRDKSNLFTQDFLYYFLGSPEAFDQFNTLAVGSTVRNLKIDSVKTVKVPLPPLAEQKRIVSILDEAFGAIAKAKENAERNLANAKELFESYLNKVFSEKGEGWEEKTLVEVTDLITCGVAKRPEYVDSGIPFLSAKNVKNGQVIWRDYRFVSEETHRQLTKHNKPCEGDILYTRVGSFGEAAIVDRDCDFSVFVSLTLIKPKAELSNRFLKHYLNSPLVKGIAAKSINGVGVGNLNVGTVRKFPIFFPDAVAQEQLADYIDKIKSESNSLESFFQQKLADLDELKQSILQKAFTGQLTSKSTELQSI